MIASIDITEIMEVTNELADLIVQSEEAREYQRCKELVAQDVEAQKLIKQFISKKEAFEEVERLGAYHPDYKRVQQELRETKRKLDMNANIAQFKKIERELGNILNEVSQIIAYAVSEHIKVPAGDPFWAVSGCAGSGSCNSNNCGNGTCGS